MKVLCVDADAWPAGVPRTTFVGNLENGKTYNVVDMFLSDGCIWFIIAEDVETDEHGMRFGYWENCFSRTSDIDEKEFERNYNKQTA